MLPAARLLLAGAGVERRDRLTRNVESFNRGAMSWEEPKMNMPKPDDKPFAIPKSMVWEACGRSRPTRALPGVDGQALDEFETDLRDNLYRIWNLVRNPMSSGSYFLPPVRAMEIPKPHGDGVRLLAI